MDKKVILVIISAIIAAACLVSLVVSRKAPVEVSLPASKAELIYLSAEEELASGEEAKAINTFGVVVENYPETSFSEKSLRKLASIYESKENITKSKYYYKRLLENFPQVEDAGVIKAKIAERVKPAPVEVKIISDDTIEYTVQPGDSLYVISRRFKTTVPLIKKMNNLTSDTIRIGQKLKVNSAEFSILVDKSDNTLVLKKNDEPYKTYAISTGRDNSTPVGVFKIIDKVTDAPWTKPTGEVILPGDPEYELGARWMAIDKPGYGIHGTNDESTIGGQVTAGCVRMYNDDVIELYGIVTVGTVVEIVD